MALGQALLGLIPKYIGFLVSFFVIGRFWLAHHRVFGLLAACDEKLIARNLGFLMVIAFGPFPTALVSDYVGAYVAIAVYAVWLMLAGLMNRRLTVFVAKTPALWASDTDAETVMRYQRGSWSPVIIGVLALAVGMIQPVFALAPLMASPLIVKLWGRWYVERSSKPPKSLAQGDEA